MSNTDADRELKLRHLPRERLIEIIEDQQDELADNEEAKEVLKNRLERANKALQDRTARLESDRLGQEVISALSDRIMKLSMEVGDEYAKRIAELERRCADLQAEVDRRREISVKAGSIAEASLMISRVFEDAQKAANEYLESVKSQRVDVEAIEREARESAAKIIRDAEDRARALEAQAAQAEERIAAREADLRRVYTEIQQSSESLRRIMG